MADLYAKKDARTDIHFENKTIVVNPSFAKFNLSHEAKDYHTNDYDSTEFERMLTSGYSFVKGIKSILFNFSVYHKFLY